VAGFGWLWACCGDPDQGGERQLKITIRMINHHGAEDVDEPAGVSRQSVELIGLPSTPSAP